MIGMPKSLTAATGMDALTHAIEAYVSIAATPITDACALKAVTMIAENLPLAVEDGSNAKAREAMAYAQFLAGMAFNNASLGYVQAPVRRLPVLMHGTRHARLSGAKDPLHVTRCVRCKGFYLRLTACLTFCARCLLHAMTTSGAIKARCTGFISSHPLFSVVYGRALSV